MFFFFVLITVLVSYLGYVIGKKIYERKEEFEKLQKADRIRRKVEIAALKGQKVEPDDDDYEGMKNPKDTKKLLTQLETKLV
jgi:hypothetical protein